MHKRIQFLSQTNVEQSPFSNVSCLAVQISKLPSKLFMSKFPQIDYRILQLPILLEVAIEEALVTLSRIFLLIARPKNLKTDN